MKKSEEDNKIKPGYKPSEDEHKNSEMKPVTSAENKALFADTAGSKNSSSKSGKLANDDSQIHKSSTSRDSEMEIHQHAKVAHESKTINEYLLEGFMIFIAVLMGFIAESIRQNFSDKEQVRQLTLQLVQDLKSDTAMLNKLYINESLILQKEDTLLAFLQQPPGKADKKRIQKLIADSHSMWPFHPSAGAIAAIKNELHLQQFSNSAIISYIAKYEGHTDLLHTIEGITLKYQRAYLDPFLTQHFTAANMQASFDTASWPSAEMRNVTQEDLIQLDADMVLIKINAGELVADNRLVRDDAVNLLRYVTKQFDVKNK